MHFGGMAIDRDRLDPVDTRHIVQVAPVSTLVNGEIRVEGHQAGGDNALWARMRFWPSSLLVVAVAGRMGNEPMRR